jgi:zinc transporter ZupT
MKPYLVYGTFITIGNIVVTLVVYLAGLHSDPTKIPIADLITLLTGLALGISFMIAGVRSKQNLTPPTDEFTFGMALGVSIVVSLFATIFTSIFQFIYQSFINPGYAEVLFQFATSKRQFQAAPADKIEAAEQFIRFMYKPAVLCTITAILSIVINVIISLIIAAFMRRKAVVEPISPPAL